MLGQIVEAQARYLSKDAWNASSAHIGGRAASDEVQRSRSALAELLQVRQSELVFTSGATESNNLALKGVAEAAGGGRSRYVAPETEHSAVLDPLKWIAGRGGSLALMPVAASGALDLAHLEAILERGDVALVSVMAANNETGILADLAVIAELAHRHGALMHTDATQIVGKLPFSVEETGVDLASVSAHKMYGPKGVGALYVRKGVELAPQMHGGGHERGLRSGTLNVPGIVGFGAAAELALEGLDDEAARQRALCDRFMEVVTGLIDGVEPTTTNPNRLPNTLSLRFAGADAEAVMANAPTVAVSAGSACSSRIPEPSHVLRAMGLSDEAARECLRISVGRPTTVHDVEEGARLLAAAVKRVRSLT